MALRNIGPKAFRKVFQPSSGPRGYSSPTVRVCAADLCVLLPNLTLVLSL
jgi:hypothetical protein